MMGGIAALILLSVYIVFSAWLCGSLFFGRPAFRLPPLRDRLAPWGGGFCLAVFALLWYPPVLLAGTIVPGWAEATMPEKVRGLVTANLLCLPAQVAGLLFLTRRATGTVLPFAGSFGRPGLLLGLAASLPLTLLTLAVHVPVRLTAHAFSDGAATEHPLLRMLNDQPGVTSLWALVIAEAVISAPVREELFFRGCVQPWLTRRPWGGDLAVALAMVCPLLLRPGGPGVGTAFVPTIFVALVACVCWWAEKPLLALRGVLGSTGLRLFPDDHGGRAAYRGVIGTSLLFAAFHSGSWPDPIPLTVIGIGLGWLAWRTQGVFASTIAHMTFNGVMLAILRFTMALTAKG
jgi:membrane protease YdiL (CAAX protease family)